MATAKPIRSAWSPTTTLRATPATSTGLGQKLVMHERHGMAKARHGLESMNYVVEKLSLMKGDTSLSGCALLVVAGPKTPLLPAELKVIDKYIEDGGNAMFMLDPFITTGTGIRRPQAAAWFWTTTL